MANTQPAKTVLGLDLGVASCGWALLSLNARNKPSGILRTGARVFEAGVEGDVQSGKDSSRAAARRGARLIRRQTERRARRSAKLFRILQEAGMLPDEEAVAGDGRDNIIKTLDKELATGLGLNGKRRTAHLLPYILRAKALDEKLAPHALGRALYHLSQRRGFKSNRKTPPKDDEDQGVVKGGIAELEGKMSAASARTLGEYFAGLDPEEERIRGRYTSRDMYEKEFEAIWTAQVEHHRAVMTDKLKRRVRSAIFHQRPLKSAKHLIGECDLERGERRAPLALLLSQRFRMLQKVNDLEIIHGETGEVYRLTNPAHREERERLVRALDTEGDLTFARIRELLNLPSRNTKKTKKSVFNLEEGGETKLVGNRTAAKLRKVFGGERWDAMPGEERDAVVDDMRTVREDNVLAIRAMTRWNLKPDAAKALAEVSLEEGYLFLSKKALARLLPELEKGVQYATARRELYPESFEKTAPLDLLPPLARTAVGKQVRNPAVFRTLTEMRKVVNSVIREHGKPDVIRVELARDLKRPRKAREEIWKRNRANQRSRDAARAKIVKEAKRWVKEPTRTDILKVQLAEECGWVCPYTGGSISMKSLFGPSPRYDIEHIIPLSRSLDDSYLNKTLCETEENRKVKRNRTPHEVYSGNREKWEAILGRIRAWPGSKKKDGKRAAQAKLRRFMLDREGVELAFRGFANRQLTDTAYASKLAREYLGLLYGGMADADGRLRVQVGAGQVTADIRNELCLNGILGDGPRKTRDDHRHHAVDAVAIALTEPGTVKKLSDAAKRARQEKRRRYASMRAPWPDFVDSVRVAVGRIVVSHRVNRKVSGALHEETIYSKPLEDPHGRVYYRARKKLGDNFTMKDVEKIIDPAVRGRVREHLKKHGNDPKKAFSDEKKMPYMKARDGRRIPIRKVRIEKPVKPVAVGSGHRARRVEPGSNHHVEIVEVKDAKGRIKWDGEVVTLLEAARRKRAGEPVVKRDHGEGKCFLFSISKKDCLIIDTDGPRRVYVVDKITPGKITITSLNDARLKAHAERFGRSPDKLRQLNCRKVSVDPIGNVRPAND